MISDINKYVDFLTKYEISEHQFLILWLVHTKDKVNVAKYRDKFGEFNISQIDDLIERGWIEDFGIIKDGIRKFNIYDFLVTDKFTKIVVIDDEDAYDELCKNYLKFVVVHGIKYPAITGDPIKLAKEYWQNHRGNRIEHERILGLTKKFVVDPNIAKVKIENYIKNKMWNLIEEGSNTGPQDAFTIL